MPHFQSVVFSLKQSRSACCWRPAAAVLLTRARHQRRRRCQAAREQLRSHLEQHSIAMRVRPQ
eukprot:3594346-Pleurochrysis_carterae.AAC.2